MYKECGQITAPQQHFFIPSSLLCLFTRFYLPSHFPTIPPLFLCLFLSLVQPHIPNWEHGLYNRGISSWPVQLFNACMVSRRRWLWRKLFIIFQSWTQRNMIVALTFPCLKMHTHKKEKERLEKVTVLSSRGYNSNEPSITSRVTDVKHNWRYHRCLQYTMNTALVCFLCLF